MNSNSNSFENNIKISFSNGLSEIVIEWIDLYGILNEFISSDCWLGLGEDKQIGQFFIEFDMKATEEKHNEQIKNKLLHYLWFDIHKSSYKTGVSLFDDSISNFSKLYDAYDNKKKIFSDAFFSCLEKKKIK